MTSRLVVDASVVLKWRLDDEVLVDAALALRQDFLREGQLELLAPSLLFYEMANGLLMAARRGRISPDQAESSLSEFGGMGIVLVNPPLSPILKLAFDLGVTAYDAAYLALAQAQGCPLWTADRELFEAASPRLTWVRWLGDYPDEG